MSAPLNPAAMSGHAMLTPVASVPLLRRALWLDATITFAGALPLVAAPALLAQLCALPEALLFWTGIALVPLAALIALFASRPALPPAAVWLVIAGNVLYTLGCAELLLGGLVAPNGWGVALIVGHGLLTLGLAEIEFFGLRKSLYAGRA